MELDPLFPVLAPVVSAQRAVRAAAVKLDLAAERHGDVRSQKRDFQKNQHSKTPDKTRPPRHATMSASDMSVETLKNSLVANGLASYGTKEQTWPRSAS